MSNLQKVQEIYDKIKPIISNETMEDVFELCLNLIVNMAMSAPDKTSRDSFLAFLADIPKMINNAVELKSKSSSD